MWRKIKWWLRVFIYFVFGDLFWVWFFGILIYIAYIGEYDK